MAQNNGGNRFFLKMTGFILLMLAACDFTIVLLFAILFGLKLIYISIDASAFYVIGILLFSFIFTGILIIRLSRKTFNQIDYITDALQKIGAGDFSARVNNIDGKDYKQIAENINQMAEELQSIETLRIDFINSFSHELKTPIVSIRGFAKLLQNPNIQEEDRKEYLDIIFTESSRLAELTGNTLLLTKLENQKIVSEKKEFSLSEQLRKSVLILESSWEKKNITFNINMPEIKITANEELLQQIWLNLINNAIKFSSDNGTIDLFIKDEGRLVEVTIKDYGIGMNEETLARIFEKYYQGDRSRATVGNGLGLSIVKRAVELTDSEIKVTSKVNEGSVFSVIIKK